MHLNVGCLDNNLEYDLSFKNRIQIQWIGTLIGKCLKFCQYIDYLKIIKNFKIKLYTYTKPSFKLFVDFPLSCMASHPKGIIVTTHLVMSY